MQVCATLLVVEPARQVGRLRVAFGGLGEVLPRRPIRWSRGAEELWLFLLQPVEVLARVALV